MTIEEVLAIEDPTGFAIALGDLIHGGSGGPFETLRPAERVAHCIDGLEREVNCGGFHCFFLNSAGDQARETVEALRAIGAPHTASLVERAMAVFPDGAPSPDHDRRQGEVDAVPEEAHAQWEALDEIFFRYEEDLTALLRAYVASHVAEFR
jgi:hypothetical protein